MRVVGVEHTLQNLEVLNGNPHECRDEFLPTLPCTITLANQPFWPDGCQHGEARYVGSAEIGNPRTDGPRITQIDVYVHPNTSNQQRVCIRTGPDIDYEAVGTTCDLLLCCCGVQRTQHVNYQAAMYVLIHNGNFMWVKLTDLQPCNT